MLVTGIIFFILTLLFAAFLYVMKDPQFGGKLTKNHKTLYAKSEQWNGKIFTNTSETGVNIKFSSIPGLIKESLRGRKRNIPQVKIPVDAPEKEGFKKDGMPKFAWYGHSAAFIQIGNQNILIDPMFGQNASPSGPISIKRFSDNTLALIDVLPQVDAVLLTHDHYDHLDFFSIKKLKNKVAKWFVPLGVKRHLERWGILSGRVTELDWWEEELSGSVKLIFTPSRHFSGRGLFDRAKSLWGGWILDDGKYKIYWSGDGGYDTHFKEIGQKFGSFDWGFMECGQYNELWHQIHMMPEETVQAAVDAHVKCSIPVHWGAFNLSLHHWTEPVRRFIREAQSRNIEYLTPRLGEIVKPGGTTQSSWWDIYR